MKIQKIIPKLFFASLLSLSASAQKTPEADCIVLWDENSIICKYIHKRVNYDKEVLFEWIEPDNTITRTRQMSIPAGHGSVYDYRYIQGRTLGEWTFRVTDEEKVTETTFVLTKPPQNTQQ